MDLLHCKINSGWSGSRPKWGLFLLVPVSLITHPRMGVWLGARKAWDLVCTKVKAARPPPYPARTVTGRPGGRGSSVEFSTYHFLGRTMCYHSLQFVAVLFCWVMIPISFFSPFWELLLRTAALTQLEGGGCVMLPRRRKRLLDLKCSGVYTSASSSGLSLCSLPLWQKFPCPSFPGPKSNQSKKKNEKL